MAAYERFVIVDSTGALVVPGLPLRPGQLVHVTVESVDAGLGVACAGMADLLSGTQVKALPISEEEIAHEIDQVRRQRRARPA